MLESYLYFPPLYQVRYTILPPNGENEQQRLRVYETLENINNLAKSSYCSLTLFPPYIHKVSPLHAREPDPTVMLAGVLLAALADG